MVDVLESFKLEGIAGSIRWLHPIDDTPADAMDKIAIEESDRLLQLTVQFCFPLDLLVIIQIGQSDSLAGLFENMQ